MLGDRRSNNPGLSSPAFNTITRAAKVAIQVEAR